MTEIANNDNYEWDWKLWVKSLEDTISMEGYNREVDSLLIDISVRIRKGPITEDDWREIHSKLWTYTQIISCKSFKDYIRDKVKNSIYENPESFLLMLSLDPETVIDTIFLKKELNAAMLDIWVSLFIKKIITLIIKLKYLTIVWLDYIIDRIKLYTKETKEQNLFSQIGDNWYRYVFENKEFNLSYTWNQEALRDIYGHYLRVRYGEKWTPEYDRRFAIFETELKNRAERV
jgi:hypothetical protein